MRNGRVITRGKDSRRRSPSELRLYSCSVRGEDYSFRRLIADRVHGSAERKTERLSEAREVFRIHSVIVFPAVAFRQANAPLTRVQPASPRETLRTARANRNPRFYQPIR